METLIIKCDTAEAEAALERVTAKVEALTAALHDLIATGIGIKLEMTIDEEPTADDPQAMG